MDRDRNRDGGGERERERNGSRFWLKLCSILQCLRLTSSSDWHSASYRAPEDCGDLIIQDIETGGRTFASYFRRTFDLVVLHGFRGMGWLQQGSMGWLQQGSGSKLQVPPRVYWVYIIMDLAGPHFPCGM